MHTHMSLTCLRQVFVHLVHNACTGHFKQDTSATPRAFSMNTFFTTMYSPTPTRLQSIDAIDSLADAYARVGYQSNSDVDLEEGVRRGSAEAAWRLACNKMYFTPQDLIVGEHYMRLAETAGLVESWHSLAICIHQGLIVGTVEERDAYLHRAADAGFEISIRLLQRIPPELHPSHIPISREPCAEPDMDKRTQVAQVLGLTMLYKDVITAEEAAVFIYGGDAGDYPGFSTLANHKEIHAEVVKLLSDKAAVQRVCVECASNSAKFPWFNLGVHFYNDDTSSRALARASRTCDHLERTLDEALKGGERSYLTKVLSCVADAFLMHTCIRIMMSAILAKKARAFSIAVDLTQGGIGALRDFVARPLRFSQVQKFEDSIDVNGTCPFAEALRSAGLNGIPLVVVFMLSDTEACFVHISKNANELGSSLVAADESEMKYVTRRMGTEIKSCCHCMKHMSKGRGCSRCKKALYCNAVHRSVAPRVASLCSDRPCTRSA